MNHGYWRCIPWRITGSIHRYLFTGRRPTRFTVRRNLFCFLLNLMYNPVSTYRIQFNKHFTFSHLDGLIPYFKKLGVKTIYASPVFMAVPESLHGYDVVNPYEINPEIGTEYQLIALIRKLKENGVGWVQDIVPNHMAFHHNNVWLMDVLEKGSMSVYASFFDITWASDFYNSRLMAPFLASSLVEAIRTRALQIVYESNGLRFTYEGQFYPLNSRTYHTILNGENAVTISSIKQFLDQVEEIHHIEDHVQYALRWYEIGIQFSVLMREYDTRTFIENCIERINNNEEKLKQIADTQFYRLCDWKETNEKINYRRFFLVNGLICLNIQFEQVFNQYHRTIGRFVHDGLFQGLRVDHVDGLYDAIQYCERLRKLCGDTTYIVVEKILEPGESLDKQWPIQGTTGYDYLAAVNNLFTRNSSENRFSQFYESLTHGKKSIEDQIADKKSAILYQYMGGELENLYHFFNEKDLISSVDAETVGKDLKQAIGEFLIHCPIYRMYGNSFPLKPDERLKIGEIFTRCRSYNPALVPAFNVLEVVLTKNTDRGDNEYNDRALQFYQRCMQFTGPLMAKGVEDTLMYTYHRFLAHNEVGDSPDFFGLTTERFHLNMQERQKHWSLSLNTTSTHDTKRGEDVRMRLNVLPDVTAEWIDLVKHWIEWNQAFKTNGFPDVNDEYFIYQTLIGSYPMIEEEDFTSRLDAYFTKAFREAKQYSDWSDPDEQYENAAIEFLHGILNPEHKFSKSFIPFQKKISDYGIVNSLAQTVLKFTCPGVPDNYQGTTSWDLSFVDPDNRRLVDYNQQEMWLEDVLSNQGQPGFIKDVWENRHDSRIKTWLMHALFKIREEHQEVYERGQYIPLDVKGHHKGNCLAFCRRSGKDWILSIVPLNMARISRPDSIIHTDWLDTRVVLPAEAPHGWRNLLFNTKGKHKGEILLTEVFGELPIAVVKLEETWNERSSGILLSISSLPSPYGIGDMGIEARNFVDFLSETRQRLWQLLPLNPTTSDVGYSPYSSYCSMAGNPLLISPQDLVEAQLLKESEIITYQVVNKEKINFEKVKRIKSDLLTKAWEQFSQNGPSELVRDFGQFIVTESHWLDDFALYEVIKSQFAGLPWYKWPDELRDRDMKALNSLKQQHTDLVNRTKWMQFMFFYQWKKLKTYCHDHGVQLFGDLPFYVNHDSVDVWAHRELFNLEESGAMKGVAGVPPDYFSESGQLWGMPVFRWDILKERNYDWWIRRIKKTWNSMMSSDWIIFGPL
ncbi:MAG: 4-alpha-glucanotransferase [Marivirga sp.]|nr:4-alpha-glucanotransferase [Marivirga sp.]